jgi:para-aminobenzoate synthetase component 1
MPEIDASFSLPLSPSWIHQMLVWGGKHFRFYAYFHSNGIAYPQGGFEQVFYAGNRSVSLANLDGLPADKPKIGIIGYDQKNYYEQLTSQNKAWIACPDSCFFSPELTIRFTSGGVKITGKNPEQIAAAIAATPLESAEGSGRLTICPRHDEESYTRLFTKIQDHILEGDIYELNFCTDYHGKLPIAEPERVYLELCSQSPMPFSALFKAEELYLCAASPERFLKKEGNRLLSQPIKGSVKRGASPEEDARLKKTLAESEKERAENLMIVDLVRNDLSRVAETGSVSVDELFGIYSFQRITQMISTVSCRLRPGTTFEEIVSKTFPMGSMTGAPKVRSMELIEDYESFRRSWFSGALGYIDSSGNFDFCVVIRSIVINRSDNSYYFGVGSAITLDAIAAEEYKECQLKAAPLLQTLKKLYQSTNSMFNGTIETNVEKHS